MTAVATPAGTNVGSRSRFAAALLAAVLVLGVLVTAVPAGAGQQAGAASTISAVVALADGRTVTAPGVRVVAALPAVHAEIVRGARAAIAGLRHVAGVLGISPDAPVHLQGKAYDGQGVYVNDVVATSGKGGGDHGDKGSGKAAAPGAGATVAVIDTGVSDTPALNRASGRLVDAVDTSGLGFDGGTIAETGPFTDGYGHGTYVASLVAGGPVAGMDQPLGVAPGATVDVVKVADDKGKTSIAAVVAGLNWVATHSDTVDIANLSLSVDRPTDAYGMDPLNYAVRLTREAGVTVVVAAGNTPGTVSDPGFDPSSLTVGAYDTTAGNVADFSGSDATIGKPELVAPGVHLMGVVPPDSQIARSNSKVVRMAADGSALIPGTGTSGATAVVSGVAAVFVGSHPQVRQSPDQVVGSLVAASGKDGLVAVPKKVEQGSAPSYDESYLAVASAWPDDFWAGEEWSTRTWSTRTWSTRTWTTRTWSTRTWSTRTWSTRTWSTRTWTTRTWTTRTWTSDSWSISGWGAS